MNQIQNKSVEFKSLGLIDYQEGWDYQTELFDGIIQIKLDNRKSGEQNPTPNYLLFCEHPHVYTLGKSGNEENLLINSEGLAAKEASFYKINRGGDITYHGPGQLVGYPIFDLENFFTDIHKYLRLIEEAIIRTLAHFDIESDRYPGLTGVWIQPNSPQARKICAIGVKSSRWVTMHGFALNVDTNLDYFSNIVPCGIDDKAVTSISKELDRKVTIEEVANVLQREFSEIFEFNYR